MTEDSIAGRILSNRYQLVELVGRGAMGKVYRAEDTLLGRVVAVKFLMQTLLNVKMRDRFRTEARTCAQLGQKSIHIVNVMDYGTAEIHDEEQPFYVMEYLQGESLGEIISSQNLPLSRFLSITRQICLGLQCAHQGITIDRETCPIIHRDIKPNNILVSKDASLGELVKILDFGIAKLLQADNDQTNSFMGTLAYSSPEQMEGRELDARSDIYSLGIMMFEMLTGKMPLQAETHSFGSWYKAHHYQPPRTFASANPGLRVPKALENLVMSCLEKSPTTRPQSIADVLKSLEPLAQRYSGNQEISQRLSEVLAKSTPQVEVKPPTESITEICQQTSWPKDKPIARIVFPQPFATTQGTIATLWVMLPKAEIEGFRSYHIYNQTYKNFLCSMSPHPMVLWVTAIYNHLHGNQKGPRWLRCYLDLKTLQGQEMVQILGDKQQYYILLFAEESPQRCAYVMQISLNSTLCSSLKEWALVSRPKTSVGQPSISKTLLQEELEKLKPKVLAAMETSATNFL